MNNKGKVLAIDFGKNNVGLAETDVGRLIVFPAGVLTGFNSIKELGNKILDRCLEKNIVAIVFGLPMGETGDETQQTQRFRNIGKTIIDVVHEKDESVEFHYVDESFSSFEGEKMGGVATGHEKAAVKILERFLELS